MNTAKALNFSYSDLKKGTEMSAKIQPSLTDEHRDLQKQIGCMNGIFQLFDRHYFLTGRRSTGHHHKRLLPGANNNGETNNATDKATEKILQIGQDQPRVSTESLGTSFSSSSCSSTFSSLDHSKTLQCKPPPFDQSDFLESPIPVKRQSSSLHFSQQSPDLRDVVKDSMQREHRVISVKTAVREEGRGRTLKHIDSPRPCQQSKPVQPRVAEFNRPNHILAKLQESPWNSKEEKDASLQQVWKEPPRFSYDERETRDPLKSTTKLKELPRLSLDSRQSSLRSSASESRLNFLLRELQRKNGAASQTINANQEPGSNKRPSSVVVKLMGLEAFPDSISNDEDETIKVTSCRNRDFLTKSSKKSEKCKKNPALFQQRVHKDPASPASNNASLGVKPTSSPRLPLETAPWRQHDAITESPRTAPGSWNSCRNTPQTSSSVYGEIEKRISELEFRKSGKDLRALKQILEAIQNTRKRLDNQDGEQADVKSKTSRYSSDYSCCEDQGSKASKWQSNKSDYLTSTKVSSSPKRFNSSNLVTKPARIMDNHRISSASVVPVDASHLPKLQTHDILCTRKDSVVKPAAKDLTPRKCTAQNPNHCKPFTDKKINGNILKVVQTRRSPQLAKVENHTAFGTSSGTVSPRFQQNHCGIEKPPHLTTPAPDLGKRRSKLTEPDSMNNKLKPKSTLHRCKDKISSTSVRKDSINQGDTASIQSESNSSLASLTETEVTSTESSILPVQNGAARLGEDMPLAELMIVPTEQPSPVSVLDATFCREDSPSPVKKISTLFQGSSLTSKMLLASGLLQDMGPVSTAIQLHSSGHLLNPDLFHVLEQTELKTMSANEERKQSIAPLKFDEKIHRKIVFDTVNEILVRKLVSESSFTQRKRTRTGQELLRELYLEVDHLQAKAECSLNDAYGFIRMLKADMNQQPDGWADYQSEVPAVVLDIERQIFKDLITEFITAEAVGQTDTRQCKTIY